MTRYVRQALVAVPTPSLPADLSTVDVELCFTPKRSAATRLDVLTAPSEWDESTTWRTQPTVERTLIARTPGRVVGGAPTCVPVPMWALEEGATEFRLRASSPGVEVVVASSEASAAMAPALKVKPKPTPTTSPTPTPTPTATPTSTVPSPVGVSGSWNLKFQDEFGGSSVDWSKWADRSHAEADGGHGNKGNQQLEWNQGKNCSVANGLLTITARPDNIRSASGIQYDWSSCLLTTTPSYSFRYGYMETRAKFPSQKGFWPAFWTWQVPGYNQWTETDAYEYYSDNPGRLYLTQHGDRGDGCVIRKLNFDPSQGFHTYGVDIKPSGTDFYVDGRRVCSVAGTSTGLTNIIVNMAVYSRIPPEPGTVGIKQVDYVRAWQR
jgi:beta-glucanase (GH16 family)